MESGGLIAKEVEFAQDKLEFKNIPQVLIELIDNPPSLEESEDKHQDGGIVQSQIEDLIFGSEKEGCLKRKVFGYLLAWSSLLKKIDCGRIKAQL